VRNVAPMLSAFHSAANSLAAAMASGQARPLEAIVDTNSACQQQKAAPEQVMDLKLGHVAPLYSTIDSLQPMVWLCRYNSRLLLPVTAPVITAQHL
jgi:hypothetical protein